MGVALPTVIYVIRSGHYYKIGRTTDLKQRVKELRVGCAEPIEIVASVIGDPQLELQLHRRYAEQRMQGEWFHLDDDDLAEIRETLAIPQPHRTPKKRPVGHVAEVRPGRWRLYAKLPKDPASGRRRTATKTIDAPTRKAALDELAIFVAQVNEAAAEGRTVATRDRTVNDLLDSWLRHTTAGETTVASWRDNLDRYVRPHIGTITLDRLTTQTLDQLYIRLIETGGQKNKGLSAATVRKAHAAIRLACAHGVRWQWLPVNPALNARPRSTPRTVVEPPSLEDVTLLIDKADQDFGTWLRLVSHLGLRREEAVGLRWSDIDLDNKTVTIRRVVTVAANKMVIRDYPKNSASLRSVAINDDVAGRLRSMRARLLTRQVAVGATDVDAYIYSPDPEGTRPFYPTTVTRRLRRLCDKLKLPPVTVRQLRHFFATRSLSRGHDVRTVAGRGGWSNPYALLNVYGHFIPASDRALADDDLDAGAI